MQKTILIVFFSLFIICGFAQNKVAWEGTLSGDYVVYKDYSWKDETYIGFLYYEPSSIGSFLYIPSKNLRITILFAVEDIDGELVLTGQNITSPRSNDELYILGVNYLMDLLPSLYNKKIKPSNKSVVVKKGRKTWNTDQFGSSCTFYYSSFIPFFYLESITDSQGRTMLLLDKIGHIKNGEDKLFFDFEPIKIKEQKNTARVKLDLKSKKEKINVEGIPLTLDSQWTKIADNSFFMKDIAFLTINKVDTKQFNMIPNDFDSSVVKLFSISRPEIKLFYDDIELIEKINGFVVSTLQYDSITNKKMKDIKVVVKKEKEQIIISLTVDYIYYRQYKSYFDSLF